MAKLFGKEYHEHSNSWFFKSSVIRLAGGELNFKKYLDERQNVIFQFEAVLPRQNVFSAKVDIVYSKKERQILEHHCSECGRDACRHFLSVVNYAYQHLATEMLDQNVVQTYQTRLLDYNEYWQRIVLNARIEIGDIYDESTDKIRFYLKSYQPMNVRLLAKLAAGQEISEEETDSVPNAEKQIMALTENELQLFALLQQSKCSFSRKGCFFTVYKEKFFRFFPILHSLQNKVFIRETGDRVQFIEAEFHINFGVVRTSAANYLLKIFEGEQISAVFVGKTTHIFRKNEIRSINLPFSQSVSRQIFDSGFPIADADLAYLASVVSRQLGLIGCYLDFDEDIELPKVFHNVPLICFDLRREDEKIIMTGLLEYAEDVFIPMSVVRIPAELVRCDQKGEVAWFYIPPQIRYQIFEFTAKLPESQTSSLENNSQLIFAGAENIDALKKIVFEFADPAWKIELSDELKKEFVYRVVLQPVIRMKKTGQINWLEYEVEYNFKDISFTQAELRRFFRRKEKFMKLADGRILFFENKEAFQSIEEMVKKSEKTKDANYRLSVYNLPYIYQINKINRGIRIIGNQFLDQMFSSIVSRRLPERVMLPHYLNQVMRSYQKAGFEWLVMLEHFGLAGILADEMGLGKTLQAISVLSRLPAAARSIVICPKTLLFNWAAEIEKFNRSLSYSIYEGNQQERSMILKDLKVNILLASYSIIQNDSAELGKIDFDYIILDEAQHIKNAAALRTRAVKKLKGKQRLALSGTPIENNPTELWSIFDFLMPGYLPALKYLKKEFTSEKQKEANQKLKMLVSPFILRRHKQDVLFELPDKQEQIAFCKLTKIQEKMYLQILESVKQFKSEEGMKSNYLHILAALTRLRQICDHPALIDDDMIRSPELSGKVELLREIIVDAVESGKKLLVFSQFVQMLQVLKEMLIKEKIAFEYLDGSTQNRRKVINNFNENNKIRLFLVSLKTGGFGLNLTAADTVVIVDPWWNPMGESQAIDRAHPIGQTRKVMVYKIITKGTIEEKILTLQVNKREMFDFIIEGGQNVLKNMTAGELQSLLEY